MPESATAEDSHDPEPSPHFVTGENTSGLIHMGSVGYLLPILGRVVWNCSVDPGHWIGFSTGTENEGIAQVTTTTQKLTLK